MKINKAIEFHDKNYNKFLHSHESIDNFNTQNEIFVENLKGKLFYNAESKNLYYENYSTFYVISLDQFKNINTFIFIASLVLKKYKNGDIEKELINKNIINEAYYKIYSTINKNTKDKYFVKFIEFNIGIELKYLEKIIEDFKIINNNF